MNGEISKQIATLCHGQDVAKNQAIVEFLYETFLASEQFLGEVGDHKKREIEQWVILCREFNKILVTEKFQQRVRETMKVEEVA